MRSLATIGGTLLFGLMTIIQVAGMAIPVLSDRYSAKQAVAAYVIPPYGWYLAVTFPFTGGHEDETEGQPQEPSQESAIHLARAVEHFNRASPPLHSILNPRDDDIETMRLHWTRALEEARMIDCEELDQIEAGLGTAAQTYLVPGLELLVFGDDEEALLGLDLVMRFGGILNSLER